MPQDRERIHGLDFLRGVASLAVCWFHLTTFAYASPDGPFYSLLRLTGAYGWLGVEVFFVISGFVIPYSLHRAGYRVGSYPAFILKRLVRLDPPYVVSVGFVLALAFGYAFLKGHAPEVEGEPVGWARVLLHLGYANIFFDHEWLNPSFWTLAIEFQYYLLVGLAYPLFVAENRWLRRAAFACCAAASLLAGRELVAGATPYSNFIVRFVPLFLLGAATFQRRAGLMGRAEYLLTLAGAALCALVTVGPYATPAGLLAVVVVKFYRRRAAVTDFLGNISYSLYLLHWPVGHLTLSIVGMKLLKAETDAARTLVIFVALAACVAAAYVLYLTVERPAQRWSSRLSYGRRAAHVEVSGLAEGETQKGDATPAHAPAHARKADKVSAVS